MSNRGRGKGNGKKKGGQSQQQVQIKTAVPKSDETQNDSNVREAIQSSEVKPEKQETSTTHDEKSSNDLSRSEDSSLKTEEPPQQVDPRQVEVAAQSKEPETSEIAPKTEQAPLALSQTQPTVAQGQAQQQVQEPRRIQEVAVQAVQTNVESSGIKELHSAEAKIEQPQRQSQQDYRDTTEFEIISSGDFTNLTYTQTQPAVHRQVQSEPVEVKPEPENHHQEVHEDRGNRQVVEESVVVAEIHHETNPNFTTEILVQQKQIAHVEQPVERRVEEQTVVAAEQEVELKAEAAMKHAENVEQRVEQPIVDPLTSTEQKHEDLEKNEVNDAAEPVRQHEHEPEVKQEVTQEQPRHHVPIEEIQQHSPPQSVHQRHDEVRVQHEKKHEQQEQTQRKIEFINQPVIESHHETVIEPHHQSQKDHNRQEHAPAQQVIDLNKPIDMDEPVVTKKTEERLFRLVESNQISINESNEIEVEKPAQVNRSDEIKVPVQSSLSFSDLNYSVERSINASQDYDRISNPAHQPEHIQQPVQSHQTNDEPLVYESVRQEAEPTQAIQISQPAVVLQESIKNSNIPEEMFYSIVPEPEIVVEVAVPAQPVVAAEPEVIAAQPEVALPVADVASPVLVEVAHPVEAVAESYIEQHRQDTVNLAKEVEVDIRPQIQVERVEVAVAANPVEEESLHQAPPEEVVEPVQGIFEPVLQAQPEPAGEPELPPPSEQLEASERPVSRRMSEIQVDPPKEEKPKKRSGLSKIVISTVIGAAVIGGGFFLLPNQKPVSMVAAGLATVATYLLA